MKNLLFAFGLAASATALAYSHIDPASVSWKQEKSGVVRVDYTLTGAAASVTLASILTNGVSVGTVPGAALTGDVNGVVQPGARSFTWTMSEKALVESKLPEGAWSFRLDVRNPNRQPDYLAIKLDDGTVAFYANAAAVPGGVAAATWKTTHLLMRRIPAANVSARLGVGPGDYRNGNYTYLPPYEQTFEEDYYMAVYETTQGQYGRLGLANPYPSGCGASAFNSTTGAHKTLHATDWEHHPVENVSFTDATAAAAALTARSATGNGFGFTFAVPTDDQWEFACRAGSSKDVYTNGRSVTYRAQVNAVYVNFQKMKNYYGGDKPLHPNYSDHIPVGQLTPNAWGLYDTLGNVEEWTVDTHGTAGCVTRGGGHGMSGENMTAPCRQVRGAATKSREVGFRLVCNLKGE